MKAAEEALLDSRLIEKEGQEEIPSTLIDLNRVVEWDIISGYKYRSTQFQHHSPQQFT